MGCPVPRLQTSTALTQGKDGNLESQMFSFRNLALQNLDKEATTID